MKSKNKLINRKVGLGTLASISYEEEEEEEEELRSLVEAGVNKVFVRRTS
jgi:hypothetical protein